MKEVKVYRVVAQYESKRRIIKIDTSTRLPIEDLIRDAFSLETRFVCHIKSLQAEILYTNEIEQGDEIIVTLLPEEIPSLEDRQVGANELNNSQEKIKIEEENFKDLKDARILEKDLLSRINLWANPLKFNMCFSEGIKFLVKGAKRTACCSIDKCPFRLFFLAPKIKKSDFESVDDIEYQLETYYAEHNHNLSLNTKNIFTPEVIKEVDLVKGCCETYQDVCEYINKKFQTNYTYQQISYQIGKLIDQNLGIPSEDANSIVEEIKKDVQLNGGYYDIELGNKDQLQKIIYISSHMLKYSEYFLDLILVDATYRRNRFNLPLINVCGVDNFGRTIMLIFALMNDEKALSYKWFFQRLKNAWNQDPKCIISDECAEIINGFLLFFIFYF